VLKACPVPCGCAKDSGCRGPDMYINDRWCKNITVKKKLCDPDIEMLVVSLRPFYLPREINNVFCVITYIPPDGNKDEAASKLHDCIREIENDSSDALKIITGDFNQCTLNKQLPNYEQVVKCNTRGDKVLDLLYCNIKGSYKAIAKPPLGDSDHNMIHLLPTYRQKLKTSKPTCSFTHDWSKEAIDKLRSKLDTTDWEVLCNATNLDDNVDILSEYINFCIEEAIPKKEVKCYSNNKPWVTKDLKELLNKKKAAVASRDKIRMREVQTELKSAIYNCKVEYKNKMEDMFKSNDTKQAWRNLKTLCSYTKKSATLDVEDDEKFANELNEFYARFDTEDFTKEQNELVEMLLNNDDPGIEITEKDVDCFLGKIKTSKAAGPDNVCGRVLKECRKQLTPILTKIFQISMDNHIIPSLWLTSELIPVPKSNLPKVKNDLRPVALTAIVMKTFERIVLKHLKPDIKPHMDKLQFAYSEGKGVDDAALTLQHTLNSHLDNPNTHARVLFVDFSSAFNTIQPHLLMKKLIDMNVNSNLILWIHRFLTNRKQYVKFNGIKSNIIVIDTGAPQGCVLSAILFIIYTYDCRSSSSNSIIIKYADDTVIIGLITKNEEEHYKDEVVNFTEWCKANFLNLNVKKTKEIIIDFRNKSKVVEPLHIEGEKVDIVQSYTYLGSIIDDKLKGGDHVQKLYAKANKRMFFLRKLKNVNVDRTILSMFYKCIIQSVLTFCITCWYGSIKDGDRKKLGKIIKCAKRLGCCGIEDLDSLYKSAVATKLTKITENIDHPLHEHFRILPSGNRLMSIYARTNRLRDSFVLSAIRLNNQR
jgi:hypothetical protein